MLQKIKRYWAVLGQSIYTGEAYNKNLTALAWFGIICALFGTCMSVMNIMQHKGFVTVTTILFAIHGLTITAAVRITGKREVAVRTATVFSALVFSYYAISGANDGFAILWMLLMPLANCYFLSVRIGILTSVYFELLVITLFYTPIRARFVGVYTETFMNRFPILYLCGLMITAVSMSQYHESVLVEMEYTERLNAQVEKQTKVANERAALLQLRSDEMVETLARAIDAKDRYTNGHSFRVSKYADALAEALGWSREERDTLNTESMLHDIGKIGISDAVLNKPGRLTDAEFSEIKSHTVVGDGILQGTTALFGAADVARHHHERYDGTGYPDGLKGAAISPHARIIAVADAYDAMYSDRIYRKGLARDVIRSELVRGRGTQFDPDMVDVFLELFDAGALDGIAPKRKDAG